MPTPPANGWLVDHDGLTPALLDPGTYAMSRLWTGDGDGDAIVLTPGDVRGTRFVYEAVAGVCPCCGGGDGPDVACGGCGTRVAYRFDNYRLPQSTRFIGDRVVWEECGEDPAEVPDPFARGAEWETGSSRRGLVGTHWRSRGLKAEVYRDDPPG